MSEEISNEPKTPIEAAIDKATGYKPGEENGCAEAAEVKTGGTKTAAQVEQQADNSKEERDWVKEAYECFVKNAVDMEPTDPVKVIAAYFEKNATDELKATAKAEGKTAEGCWKFIEAVARKALGGRSGHIDPVTVYAIAMHYFQDVPALADFEPKLKAAEEKARKANLEKKYKENQVKHNAEVRAKAAKKAAKTRKKNAKAKAEKQAEVSPTEPKKPVAKPKAKKGGKEQGFFFDLLETEPVGGTDIDGKEDGDAE